MARSLLVVLPIADTTTMGRRSTRDFTIPATRSMAAADSTDDPPNFITIMALAQQSFRLHQFGVQHGGSGSSPHGVVAEDDELPIEDRALAQAADEGSHTALALHV